MYSNYPKRCRQNTGYTKSPQTKRLQQTQQQRQTQMELKIEAEAGEPEPEAEVEPATHIKVFLGIACLWCVYHW